MVQKLNPNSLKPSQAACHNSLLAVASKWSVAFCVLPLQSNISRASKVPSCAAFRRNIWRSRAWFSRLLQTLAATGMWKAEQAASRFRVVRLFRFAVQDPVIITETVAVPYALRKHQNSTTQQLSREHPRAGAQARTFAPKTSHRRLWPRAFRMRTAGQQDANSA